MLRPQNNMFASALEFIISSSTNAEILGGD